MKLQHTLVLGGRVFHDVDAWQRAAETAARTFLRARSPILDISRDSHPLASGIPHHVVFDAKVKRSVPPARRSPTER